MDEGLVQLDIISVAVEAETVMTNDLAEGEKVKDKEKRTKRRTLGDTLGQGCSLERAIC